MTWLCEMTALHAAAARFAGRMLWLDFDRFLAAPAERLADVLRHFKAADADAAARAILSGPIMGQYAKGPAQRFDAEFRRRLLDQAGRQHAVEVERGLAWLGQAAADADVRWLVESANAGGE
jgi:hypothetical protein